MIRKQLVKKLDLSACTGSQEAKAIQDIIDEYARIGFFVHSLQICNNESEFAQVAWFVFKEDPAAQDYSASPGI